MKKVVLILALLLGGGLILLVGLRPFGVDVMGWRGVWDPEQAFLHQKAYGFLESLQYKDFKTAAAFHTWADEQKADIPRLIERLFKVKPEQLNIREIIITGIDLDQDRQRARTHFTAVIELLNSKKNEEVKNEERRVEGILYWHKRPAAEDDPPTPEASASAPQASPAPSGSAPPPAVTAGGEQRWFLKLESSLREP